eukprot:6178674-Prymnesium_polylepis.1
MEDGTADETLDGTAAEGMSGRRLQSTQSVDAVGTGSSAARLKLTVEDFSGPLVLWLLVSALMLLVNAVESQ